MSNTKNTDSRYKRNEEMVFSELEGKVFILDDENDILFELNPTASFVWLNLEKEKSLQELVNALIKEFEVSKSIAEEDLNILLEDFMQKTLIKEV